MALTRGTAVMRRLRHPACLAPSWVSNARGLPAASIRVRHCSSSEPPSGDGRDGRSGSVNGKGMQRNRFLDRLLAVDESGQSPFLRLLGYYSPESRAIGAARSLYEQILRRGRAILEAEYTEEQRVLFVPKYETLAIHVYLTFQRLRAEGGSAFEKDVKIAMQTLFDMFWTDVRVRMMIEEHELTLLTSAKWIRQCERNFFSMALAFDEAWSDQQKMSDKIALHITSLKKDPIKVGRFHSYMHHEHERLKKVSVEQIWEGICWDAKYPAAV